MDYRARDGGEQEQVLSARGASGLGDLDVAYVKDRYSTVMSIGDPGLPDYCLTSVSQGALAYLARASIKKGEHPFERPDPQTFIDAAQPLLITGVFSGAIAFTMQICAQKHTPPAEAALVLSTESLFAALGGAVFLGEEVSELSMIGGPLILAGAAAADGAPPILRFLARGGAPSAV